VHRSPLDDTTPPGVELAYSLDAAPAVLLTAGIGLLLAAAVRRPLPPLGARAPRWHVI